MHLDGRLNKILNLLLNNFPHLHLAAKRNYEDMNPAAFLNAKISTNIKLQIMKKILITIVLIVFYGSCLLAQRTNLTLDINGLVISPGKMIL